MTEYYLKKYVKCTACDGEGYDYGLRNPVYYNPCRECRGEGFRPVYIEERSGVKHVFKGPQK